MEWLIWSIQHDMWWKAGDWGYTKKKSEAGRYDFEEACRIVSESNRYSGNRPEEAMVRDEGEVQR